MAVPEDEEGRALLLAGMMRAGAQAGQLWKVHRQHAEESSPEKTCDPARTVNALRAASRCIEQDSF
jgi:hypothetical protein